MPKTYIPPNPMVKRHGQSITAIPKLKYWRRSLLTTYGMLERLCAFNGGTFLCNERISKEIDCDISTVVRHIQGITKAGAALALYGRRHVVAHRAFNGTTRWMLTLGPFFEKGFRRAIKKGIPESMSFFSASPLTDKERVPDNVWHFFANQEALFPGTARKAAEAFHMETTLLPDGVEFTGQFDRAFFCRCIRVFCSEDIRNSAYLSVLPPSEERTEKTKDIPARPAVDAGNPSAAIFSQTPAKAVGKVTTQDPEIAAAPSPAVAEMASDEPASVVPVVREPIAIRRFAYHLPEAFNLLCMLLPDDPPTQWKPKVARRMRKLVKDESLSEWHILLLLKHTPEKRRKYVTRKNLFDQKQRDILLIVAANNFRATSLCVFDIWNRGMNLDQEILRGYFRPEMQSHQTLVGWGGDDEPVPKEDWDFSEIDSEWAWRAAYRIHKMVLDLEQSGRLSIEAGEEHHDWVTDLAPFLLEQASKYPIAWRNLLRLAKKMGTVQFAIVFGFSVADLKHSVKEHCLWLKSEAADMQRNWSFLDEIYDRKHGNLEADERIPRPEKYELTNLQQLLDERFDY